VLTVKKIVVGIHEAKTHFSKLVKQAQAGQEIVVENYGKPVAKIVGYASEGSVRKPGMLAGKITIKPNFDELPEGFEDAFGV
jgi:prevent-host-death family protein